ARRFRSLAAGARRRREGGIGGRREQSRPHRALSQSSTPQQEERRMITAVNHVALAADDPRQAAADYERVFGRKPHAFSGADGSALYRLQLDNIAFEITRANGAAGLYRVGFEVDDMIATARKFGRRGLGCEAPVVE